MDRIWQNFEFCMCRDIWTEINTNKRYIFLLKSKILKTEKHHFLSFISKFFLYLNENQQVKLQKYTKLENIIFLRHLGMFWVHFGRKKKIEHCRTRYQRIIISKMIDMCLNVFKTCWLTYLRHVVITVWVNTENRGLTDEKNWHRLQNWAYQAHISISPLAPCSCI